MAEVPYLDTVVCVAVFYLALGHRSLHDHARPMAAALSAGDATEARRLVGLIVSRDPASLDITRAATESVLENGNDAVFGALFWFVVAGAPGVVVYRLANCGRGGARCHAGRARPLRRPVLGIVARPWLPMSSARCA